MIGIIVNPRSGKNRKGRFGPEELETLLEGRAVARATAGPEEVRPVLAEFADRGVSLLCISGGDGTMHLTLTEVIHFCREHRIDLPLIYPMRGGVMNMVSNEVTSHFGNPAGQCRKLRAFFRARAGKGEEDLPTRTLPMLKIEEDPPGREVYAFTFASGILYRGFEEYNRVRRGVLRAAALAVSIIFRTVTRNPWSRPTAGRVIADQAELPFAESLFTLAATVRNLVLWFSPFAPAPEAPPDSFFGLCCALSPGEIARHLVAYSRGKRTHERHFNRTARELLVEGPDGFVLDGEMYPRPDRFRARITCGPVLRFLAMP